MKALGKPFHKAKSTINIFQWRFCKKGGDSADRETKKKKKVDGKPAENGGEMKIRAHK